MRRPVRTAVLLAAGWLACAVSVACGKGDPVEAVRQQQARGDFEESLDPLRELLEAFHEFSPVLRRALQHEHHFDVERWEQRLGGLLRPVEHPDPAQQNDLFD